MKRFFILEEHKYRTDTEQCFIERVNKPEIIMVSLFYVPRIVWKTLATPLTNQMRTKSNTDQNLVIRPDCCLGKFTCF